MGNALSDSEVANGRFSSLLLLLARKTGLQSSEVMLLAVVLLFVWSAAIGAIGYVKSDYSQRVGNQLATLLDSADQSIRLWSQDKKAVEENLASDKILLAATRSLIRKSGDRQSLLAAPEQGMLREMFRTFLKGGNLRGFFIIDRNNINLASSRDVNVGDKNLLTEQPDILKKMWQGEVVISRVQISDVPMPSQKAIDVGTRDLNMFVGGPIRNNKGKIIALLTLRIDPNQTLFSLLERARPGKTGETYLFDRQGLMLSPSRFREDLIDMGLIKPDESSVARVYIRDNSEGPAAGLTRMAASATQGGKGTDVSGYPDYRGKQVVGAWQWEDNLDLGLTVEQDYDEAYGLYFEMRAFIYAAGIVASIALLLLAVFFGRGKRKVEETQNRLSAVVEYTMDSIIVINRLGIIESANQAVQNTFGYLPSELVGNNVSMLMPEPHRGAHNGYISRYLETGEAHVIGIGREVQAVRADGSVFPAELTISKFELSSGVHFAGTLRDLTLRKRTEEELRMKSLVAAETDIGVVVMELDQKIKWVNPGFTQITGYQFHEAIGKKRSDFLQGQKTEKDAVRRIDEAIRQQQRTETDITVSRKNGEVCVLHIEIMPIRDNAGEVVEFISLESDVTEQRLAETRIREAKEAAEAANRAKSSFLAAMSHEIRTPLNGVVGSIDLLSHTRLESNQRDMVRTVQDSSYALMSIIDDILDFSKIEAGRLELDDAPFSLQQVVEGCVESLHPSAAKKNVELLMFCDPSIPELVGDAGRLRQILFNLTGNAIKFSSNVSGRKGRVEVSAVVERMDGRDVGVRLAVKDNGIGMSDEAQKKLFRPFVQAESSTTRRFGGTGLGLAISKRLVEMMGGRIELESRPDEGAHFSVALTMQKASDRQIVPAGELEGLQLLLVKGDPEAVRIIDSYLRYAACEVIAAAPADAVDQLDKLMQGEKEMLLVCDTQGEESSTEQLRESLREKAAGKTEVRFLVIGRGRRRYVRPSGEDGMSLDINVMRRSTLINAVAALAGIESPEIGKQEQDYDFIAELPTREEARAGGRLVLVAEDNETNRNVLRQQLGLLGFVAEMAEDGMQALEMWRKEKYPLLLTDCHMPEMDGYNLTRAIREEEGDSGHTTIIAITADALKGTEEKCLAAGMDDYVTKPMQIPELRDVLEKWTHGKLAGQVADELAEDTADRRAIDPDALSSLLGTDDPATLARFRADFLRSGMATVEQIRAAHAEGKTDTVGELAHKLKSAARTVGANALADCCLAIEQAGKAGEAQAVDRQMGHFSVLFEEVREWLGRHETTKRGHGKS